jgi:protein arginine kinase activator
MRCDRCDNEATVHEVRIISGKKTEVHLCQTCAQALGIVGKSQANIAELLTKMVMQPGPTAAGSETAPEAAPTEPRSGVCDSCGCTFSEIRKTGLIGCSDCYRVFADQLGPLLERAHEGGTHHLGKTPRRAGGEIDRQYLVLRLRQQLEEAVSAEEYERAATLRDQLRQAERPDLARQSEGTEETGESTA